MTGDEWRMEGGERIFNHKGHEGTQRKENKRKENGEWRMEDGEWRNGEMRGLMIFQVINQRDKEPAACRIALRCYFASMQFHDGFGNRQAQA